MSFRALKTLSLLVALVALSACSSTKAQVKSPQEYFKEGESAYLSHDYEEAIKLFKKVKESYSSTELTARAELKIADVQFDNKAYIEAAAAYEDFRKLHPTHDKAAYALYRLGLSYYLQVGGIDTDQTPVKSALTTFDSFLSRYPASPFATEVKEKREDCLDKELQYEIYVGHFYLRTGKYDASIKRLNEALARFPKMPRQAEALYYLGKAYLKVGAKDKGEGTFKRLAAEYPQTSFGVEAKELLVK